MSNEFFLVDFESINDWDEGELIDELSTINSHVAVAVAMNFFGISQLNTRLPLMIDDTQIDTVIKAFDEYCSTYTFTVGVDENKRTFQKP